jgi:uncharacterized RDD family membrane protein YckC
MYKTLPQRGLSPIEQEASNANNVAMIGWRWLGCWIDLIVLALMLFAAFAVVPRPLAGESASTAALWLVLAPMILYFPLCEGIWGRTVGKLAAGLYVVDKHGNPPGLWRAFLRTLTRLFEVNPFLFGGVPAGIVVLCTNRGQRLGDMLAGTFVVRKSQLEQAAKAAAVSVF